MTLYFFFNYFGILLLVHSELYFSSARTRQRSSQGLVSMRRFLIILPFVPRRSPGNLNVVSSRVILLVIGSRMVFFDHPFPVVSPESILWSSVISDSARQYVLRVKFPKSISRRQPICLMVRRTYTYIVWTYFIGKLPSNYYSDVCSSPRFFRA